MINSSGWAFITWYTFINSLFVRWIWNLPESLSDNFLHLMSSQRDNFQFVGIPWYSKSEVNWAKAMWWWQLDSNQRSHFATLVRSSSQSAYNRPGRRLYLLLTTLPPRFIPHCGRSAPRPIDVNDVLSHHGRNYKPLSTGQQASSLLKSKDSAFRRPSGKLLKTAVYPSVYPVHKCRTQPYTTPAVHKNGHQILLWCRCCFICWSRIIAGKTTSHRVMSLVGGF